MLIRHKSPNRSSRVQTDRADKIAAGFLWNGILFQTRENDLSLIAGRATKIAAKKALNEPVADFYWRAADNTDHLFTGDEFLRFAVAVDEFVESKYIESWQ